METIDKEIDLKIKIELPDRNRGVKNNLWAKSWPDLEELLAVSLVKEFECQVDRLLIVVSHIRWSCWVH